ncbi:MAG: hypothetical protein Q8S09_10345 [Hyphomonas sp.]|nr:hypothetical protein [Hyphomonas sp.]
MSLNVVNAASRIDLADQIGEAGLSIPDRGVRTNQDEEAYLCRRFILGMAADERLSYPISIRQSDAPDFEITEGREVWQLEITQATSNDDQVGLTRFAKSAVSVAPNGHFGGRGLGGYQGDQPEFEVISDIVDAINRKKAKEYAKESCRLLVYVNSNPGLVVHTDRLFEMLPDRLPQHPFDAVYVYANGIFGEFPNASKMQGGDHAANNDVEDLRKGI